MIRKLFSFDFFYFLQGISNTSVFDEEKKSEDGHKKFSTYPIQEYRSYKMMLIFRIRIYSGFSAKKFTLSQMKLFSFSVVRNLSFCLFFLVYATFLTHVQKTLLVMYLCNENLHK